MKRGGGSGAGEILPGRTRWGEATLLTGAMAALGLAWILATQPAFSGRAGPEALPHLSVEPIPVWGFTWGAETLGPGSAFAGAEGLLLASSLVLLLVAAAVGGLGQLALAGVAAVARRPELRLRRALGASIRRLLRGLRKDAMGTAGVALVAGAGLIPLLGLSLHLIWRPNASVPWPWLNVGSLPVLTAALGLVSWAAFAFLVIQSGETRPRCPLHRRAPLGGAGRGELGHPGVPVLQVAAATLMLLTANVLLQGPDRVLAGGGAATDPPAGIQATGSDAEDEVRLVVRYDPRNAAEAVGLLLSEAARLQDQGPGRGLSVTSPGFWEGIGHVRYAETECGRCFIPGNPPLLAPYKGEAAVHHAVSPDTFWIAGLEVLEGRAFTDSDTGDAEPVAAVSRAFAFRNFENGEALGRRIRIGEERGRMHTVVAVVQPLPRRTLAARSQPAEDVLVPVAQLPMADLELVAAGIPGSVVEGLTGGGDLLERAPIRVRSGHLRSWVQGHVGLGRAAGLAGAALALLGTALTVARRIREEAPEIALRRAVGATRGRLVLAYLVFGLRLGALGVAVGCWAALFAVSVVVPEGFGRPGAIAPLFVPMALALVLASGAAAAGTAAVQLRGNPVEALDG